MRALDFFLQYYNCELEDFLQLLNTNHTNIFIPQYLCAHPRLSILGHIEECIIIDFVLPPTFDYDLPIICLCQATLLEPPVPVRDNHDRLDRITKAWNEPFYLHIDDIEICPTNPHNFCQFRGRNTH
jgi:hypothetical protein